MRCLLPCCCGVLRQSVKKCLAAAIQLLHGPQLPPKLLCCPAALLPCAPAALQALWARAAADPGGIPAQPRPHLPWPHYESAAGAATAGGGAAAATGRRSARAAASFWRWISVCGTFCKLSLADGRITCVYTHLAARMAQNERTAQSPK